MNFGLSYNRRSSTCAACGRACRVLAEYEGVVGVNIGAASFNGDAFEVATAQADLLWAQDNPRSSRSPSGAAVGPCRTATS